MPKLISDTKGIRKFTIELTEQDLVTIVASMGVAKIEDIHKFAENFSSLSNVHDSKGTKDLYNELINALF